MSVSHTTTHTHGSARDTSKQQRCRSVLRPADLVAFEGLGVPTELLEHAGIRRVTDREARDDCGIHFNRVADLAGILFPGCHPESAVLRGYRVLRDHPEIEAGKPKDKYVSSKDLHHWFFLPSPAPRVRDVSQPIVFVEAEKSCLTIEAAAHRAGRGLLPIALGGCWEWKAVISTTSAPDGARVPKKGPATDFDLLEWRGREAKIAFDANATTNSKVQGARRALAKELATRGAHVRIVDIPAESDVDGPGKPNARLQQRHSASPRTGCPKSSVDGSSPALTKRKPWLAVLDQPIELLFEESPVKVGAAIVRQAAAKTAHYPDPELALDGVMQSRRPMNSPK
jgi:hypothetical protein